MCWVWALAVTGPKSAPLRLLPALAGALMAPLLYLLASRLYGWRVGLAAGGCSLCPPGASPSAASVWSPITAALDLACYLCPSWRCAPGGWAATGWPGYSWPDLHMYYVARLMPLVIVLVFLHQLISSAGASCAPSARGAGLSRRRRCSPSLPVGLFAIQQPEFMGRVNDVSVFNPDANGGDPLVFLDSLEKHLRMFNWAGDGNARHNLAGAPMLDSLMARSSCWGWATAPARGAGSSSSRWPGSASTWVGCCRYRLKRHRPPHARNSVVTALLAGIVLGELWQCLTRPRRVAEEEDAGAVQAATPRKSPFRTLPWAGRARPKAPATTLPTRRRPVAPGGAMPARGQTSAAEFVAPERAVVATVADLPSPIPQRPARMAAVSQDVAGGGSSRARASGARRPRAGHRRAKMPPLDAADAAPQVLAPVPATVRPRPSRGRLIGWAVSGAGFCWWWAPSVC